MSDVNARVLVVVGTDKHPFDRLSSWLEQWYDRLVDQPSLTVQHGHGRPAKLPGAVAFLDHNALGQAMREATLIVCHGGPATILEARRLGRLPIVVPRDPTHREHVDEHQQLFARRLGAVGMVRLCETVDELTAALDEGLAEPTKFEITADPFAAANRAEAVARVGGIVDGLIDARARRQAARGRR